MKNVNCFKLGYTSITNVAPGGSSNQIAVFKYKNDKDINLINRFTVHCCYLQHVLRCMPQVMR